MVRRKRTFSDCGGRVAMTAKAKWRFTVNSPDKGTREHRSLREAWKESWRRINQGQKVILTAYRLDTNGTHRDEHTWSIDFNSELTVTAILIELLKEERPEEK